MSEKQDVCVHPKVYRKYEVDGVSWSGEWACGTCNAKFYHMEDMVFPAGGKLTVMDPQATLRDQFAMAALSGMMYAESSMTANNVAKLGIPEAE